MNWRLRRHPDQRQGLYDLIRDCGPIDRMVEVGSHSGESAFIFAPLVAQLYCVDAWRDGIDSCQRHREVMAEVEQLFEERMGAFPNVEKIRNLSVEAAEMFSDGSVDLVYLDAGHDEDSVLADLKAWKPKVRPGGFLAGHDFGNKRCPGVELAVRKFFGCQPDVIYCDSSWMVRLAELQCPSTLIPCNSARGRRAEEARDSACVEFGFTQCNPHLGKGSSLNHGID